MIFQTLTHTIDSRITYHVSRIDIIILNIFFFILFRVLDIFQVKTRKRYLSRYSLRKCSRIERTKQKS